MTAKSDVPFGISQDFESILCYAKPLFKAGIKVKERKYYDENRIIFPLFMLTEFSTNGCFTLITLL